jgi:hypothetical protein
MLVIALRNFNLGRGAHAVQGQLYDMPEFQARARIGCGHVRAATEAEVEVASPPTPAPITGFEVQDPTAINREPRKARRGRGT